MLALPKTSEHGHIAIGRCGNSLIKRALKTWLLFICLISGTYLTQGNWLTSRKHNWQSNSASDHQELALLSLHATVKLLWCEISKASIGEGYAPTGIEVCSFWNHEQTFLVDLPIVHRMKASRRPRHGMVSHEAAPFQIYRPKEDWGEFSLSEGMAEEEQSDRTIVYYYLHSARGLESWPQPMKERCGHHQSWVCPFVFSASWYLDVSCHLFMSVSNVEMLPLVFGSRERLVCENIKIGSTLSISGNDWQSSWFIRSDFHAV